MSQVTPHSGLGAPFDEDVFNPDHPSSQLSTLNSQLSALRPPHSSHVTHHSSLPSIIAFTGRAGAGKTTAAQILGTVQPGYHRLSFANPLRSMLCAIGLNGDDFALRKEQPHPLLCGQTPRHALQTLGTEWGRLTIGHDIWLNAARHRALQVLALGECVVFDDVRFDNEARMIHTLGGQVVKVHRPGLAPSSAHASEAGITEKLVDHHLFASDLEQLRGTLCAWLNSFAHP